MKSLLPQEMGEDKKVFKSLQNKTFTSCKLLTVWLYRIPLAFFAV